MVGSNPTCYISNLKVRRMIMSRVKKQILGAVVFSLVCSLVLGCVLGLAITGVVCYQAVYVNCSQFDMITWIRKLCETSMWVFIYVCICVFAMNLAVVLMYKVNNSLFDKVHECRDKDEKFMLARSIPDVKKYIEAFEEIGSSFSKAS